MIALFSKCSWRLPLQTVIKEICYEFVFELISFHSYRVIKIQRNTNRNCNTQVSGHYEFTEQLYCALA